MTDVIQTGMVCAVVIAIAWACAKGCAIENNPDTIKADAEARVLLYKTMNQK